MNLRLPIALLAASAAPVLAQANSLAFVSVPALDDVGLAGLTLVVAIAGGLALRRRRRK